MSRARKSLLASLSALVVAPFVPMGAAHAEVFSETTAAWETPDATVANMSTVTAVGRVNLNDREGGSGSQDNVIATWAFNDYSFIEQIPTVCLTGQSDPALDSVISADKHTLTCNVGTVKYGTAAVVKVAVRVKGPNSAVVNGTFAANGVPPKPVPDKTIVAKPGLDLVFDANHTVQTGDGAAHVWMPVALSVPVGNEMPSGPLKFRVTTSDDTSNASSTLVPVPNCVDYNPNLSGGVITSTIPANQSWFPRPDSCTVTKVGPGVFDVTFDGYDHDAYAKVAANGAALPADRLFVSAFALEFNAPGYAPVPSSFDQTAAFTSGVTASGVPEVEVDLTNNTETRNIVKPGGFRSGWNRTGWAIAGDTNPAHVALFDGAVNSAGQNGAMNDAALKTVPDSIVAASVGWAGHSQQQMSTIPAGTQDQDCLYLTGPAEFTGRIALNPNYTNSEDPLSQYYGTGALHFYYSSSTVADPSTFTCNDITNWTEVSETFLASDTAAVNNVGDVFDLNTPAGARAIKLVVDVKNTKTPMTKVPSRLNLYAPVHVRASASPVEDVWTFGAAFNTATGTWINHETIATMATGLPNPPYDIDDHTTLASDALLVLPWRPLVRKTVDNPAPEIGDTVTWTIDATASVNTGTLNSTPVDLVDTLPAGIKYVSSSPAADVVTVNPNGTTTVEWHKSMTYNTGETFTVTTVVEGVKDPDPAADGAMVPAYTNIVTMDDESLGSYVPTVQNGGQSNSTVRINDFGDTFLEKTVSSDTFAAGAGATWTLTKTNHDTRNQRQTDIIDILPWNGDSRGTHYTGRVGITDVTLNAGEEVWYTTAAPGTINPDPADASNGGLYAPGGIWSQTKPADLYDITGVRIVGNPTGDAAAPSLFVGEAKSNQIVFDTKGGSAADFLSNIAYLKATHTELQHIKADATTTVADGSDLQIDKSEPTVGGWKAGDAWTYTITVKNPTSKTAYDVDVTDKPGNGLEGAVFSSPSQGSVDGSDAAVWHIGDLAAGASVTATVTVKVAADANYTTAFVNNVSVENPSNPFDETAPCGQPNDTVDADVDQCDTVPTPVPAEVRVDIAQTPVQVAAGEDCGAITYTVKVGNFGPGPSSNVVSKVSFPEGVTAADLSGVVASKGTFDPATGVWDIGALAIDEVVTLTVTACVPVETLLTGEANATSTVTSTEDPGPDGVTANADLASDTDDYDEVVADYADVRINVNNTPVVEIVEDCAKISWTVEVSNFGPDTAHNTFTQFTYPAGVDASTVALVGDPTKGTFDPATGKWVIGDAVPGEVYTITFTGCSDIAAVQDGDAILDGTVSSDEDFWKDGDVTNQTVEGDKDNFDAVPALLPRLKVDKAVVLADAKDSIEWTVTVLNDGNTDAADVTVTDTYPANVAGKATAKTPSKGDFDAATGVWTVGTLAPGEAATVVFTIPVTADELNQPEGVVNVVKVGNPLFPAPEGEDCGQVNPGAGVTGGEGDVKGDTDQCDQTITRFTDEPVLALDKHLDAVNVAMENEWTPAKTGAVTWTISVGNTGTVTSHDTVMKDSYPAGIDPKTVKVVGKPTQGEFDNMTGEWKIGDLAPGAVVKITYSATVATDLLIKGIENRAAVGSVEVPYKGGTTLNENLAGDTDGYDAVKATFKVDTPTCEDETKETGDMTGDGKVGCDKSIIGVIPNAGGPALGVAAAGLLLLGLGGVAIRRSRRKEA